MTDRLVLGLVPSARLRERDPRILAFVHALGDRAGLYIVERAVSSYEELEHEMTLAHIDVAWLPPLVFARLERDAVAVALATRASERDTYASVLVAKRGARVQSPADLPGRSIAWVDPLSASGYVVPRLALITRGYEPHATFAYEFFAGSHTEALRAVLEGRVDVAATFAHVNAQGGVVRGPWSEIGVKDDAIHVVAVLGEIPLDLIAARASVPEEVRGALAKALVEMETHPELGPMLEAVFGCRKFERGTSASYESLRNLLVRASDPALGWASESFESTAPPPGEAKEKEEKTEKT